MGPAGKKRRQIEVLSDVVFAPENPDALISQMADPAIRIVSMTITEKGYCHVPSTGRLDLQHPDVQHDLTEKLPKTAIGYLVRALQLRRAQGIRPFTVLSCDNLPDNGRVARRVVLDLAEKIDGGLADWIAAEGRFPTTMVDRIVPATTPENIENLSNQIGRRDNAPVFHEPFRQWVIQDSFVDGARPALELVSGVQLVQEVAPFEAMKLRMLNGTHSALAYLGYLAGHETIAETAGDPVFRNYLHVLWHKEIIPTVTPPEDVALPHYAEALLERYSNPSIRHRTWQIAMDGSQKLPQRILGTIADNLQAGRPSPGLILALAGWMRYVGGVNEKGAAIDVRDPLAEQLRRRVERATSAHEKVKQLLSITEIFEPTFAARIAPDVTAAYDTLLALGAAASVRQLDDASGKV